MFQRRYIPCQCWSADHFLAIDTDPDSDDEITISAVSRRNSSFWHRVRWALKHVFGREDLVFADLIVKRDDLESIVKSPGENDGGPNS